MIRFCTRLVAIPLLAVTLAACSNNGGDNEAETPTPQPLTASEYTTTDSGLQIHDFVEGDGDTATAGDRITVHYSGWLASDSTLFDSSIQRGQPFSFVLGAGRVIPGWDEGVAGMRVGGERQLVIPPELGYGSQGAGNSIPPNATLIFEVELLSVESGS